MEICQLLGYCITQQPETKSKGFAWAHELATVGDSVTK